LSQRFYVGLRIQYDGVSVPDDEVLPPYNMVIGVDIAKGPEDTAFYIQAGSPW
jgi:hypothetical protein